MSSLKAKRGRFNRTRLPTPTTVLQQLGIYPGKSNAKGYLVFRCPFHNNGNELHPSFNLHQVDGHFRCHACGVKGRDILDFYRRVTGKQFIEACIALGAWEQY